MVNIGLSKVDDAVAAKHPGIQQYTSCQSRAFMTGIGSFVVGTAGVFAIQKALQKRLPYPLKWNLLVSIVTGSICSYVVTQYETQKCSDLWVNLETGRHRDGAVQKEVPSAADGPKTTQYGDEME